MCAGQSMCAADARPRSVDSSDSSAPAPPAAKPSVSGEPSAGAEQLESARAPQRPGRVKCKRCGSASVLYCPYCQIPHVPCPEVQLPLEVDVVFCDKPQKATGLHAKLLAPRQVRIVDLFTNSAHSTISGDDLRELPEYDEATTLLGYPGPDSLTFDELPEERLRSARRLVVIDSPWKKSHGLQSDPRLRGLCRVQLGKNAPKSRFWRYHAEGNDQCLSTIEALTALLRDADMALRRPAAVAVPAALPAPAPSALAAPAGACGAASDGAEALQDGLLYFFDLQLRAIGEARRDGHDPTSREAKEELRARRSQCARHAKRQARPQPGSGDRPVAGAQNAREDEEGTASMSS